MGRTTLSVYVCMYVWYVWMIVCSSWSMRVCIYVSTYACVWKYAHKSSQTSPPAHYFIELLRFPKLNILTTITTIMATTTTLLRIALVKCMSHLCRLQTFIHMYVHIHRQHVLRISVTKRVHLWLRKSCLSM